MAQYITVYSNGQKRPAAFRVPRSQSGSWGHRGPRRRRSARRPAGFSQCRLPVRSDQRMLRVLPDRRVEQVDTTVGQAHESGRLPQASSRRVADTSGLSPMSLLVRSIRASIASRRALPLIGAIPVVGFCAASREAFEPHRRGYARSATGCSADGVQHGFLALQSRNLPANFFGLASRVPPHLDRRTKRRPFCPTIVVEGIAAHKRIPRIAVAVT